MCVDPLLQALIDAAQSEQTSRTIRIVCTILVSLLYLIGLACLFLLVFVIEGQGLFIRGFWTCQYPYRPKVQGMKESGGFAALAPLQQLL